MGELGQREAMAARALEFCILTAARSGEVLGLRWSEIDLDKALWTVPAERMMKASRVRRVHRVPLCDPALAILKQLAERAAWHVCAHVIGSLPHRAGNGCSPALH